MGNEYQIFYLQYTPKKPFTFENYYITCQVKNGPNYK